jgi:glutathione S-transferase
VKIYGDTRSGNRDKVRFTVDYLRLPYEWIEIDSVAGQVPVAQLGDGRFLAQSNAIIRCIADESPLSPADKWSKVPSASAVRRVARGGRDTPIGRASRLASRRRPRLRGGRLLLFG